MFGMTISFYALKYILGFYIERFANDGHFQVKLFIVYSVLSFICGAGSFILYYWNKHNTFNSVLYALPSGGLIAEGVACLFALISRHMLLGQTIFNLLFALIFGFLFFKKANNKTLYVLSILVVGALTYLLVYKSFLLAF